MYTYGTSNNLVSGNKILPQLQHNYVDGLGQDARFDIDKTFYHVLWTMV